MYRGKLAGWYLHILYSVHYTIHDMYVLYISLIEIYSSGVLPIGDGKRNILRRSKKLFFSLANLFQFFFKRIGLNAIAQKCRIQVQKIEVKKDRQYLLNIT